MLLGFRLSQCAYNINSGHFVFEQLFYYYEKLKRFVAMMDTSSLVQSCNGSEEASRQNRSDRTRNMTQNRSLCLLYNISTVATRFSSRNNECQADKTVKVVWKNCLSAFRTVWKFCERVLLPTEMLDTGMTPSCLNLFSSMSPLDEF